MDKEVSEVDRKLFLRKSYLDKIHYYINRNPINQDELYVVVRKFFGEYLKLDYEFTYEELSQELNKVFIAPKLKEHIDDFLLRLSESEYLEETTLGTIEINGYLEELGEIIRTIISDDKPVQVEETLLQKVLHKNKATKSVDVASVSAMIEEIHFHITSGHIDVAKTSYIDLIKAYDSLSKDDKKRLHDDINEVYERLQNLIKNPKSQTSRIKKTQENVDSQSTEEPMTIADILTKVRTLADETMGYIDAADIEAAKKGYSETLKVYESLKPEDREVVHLRVSRLYMQLQALLSESKSVEKDKKEQKDQISSRNLQGVDNIVAPVDLSSLSSGEVSDNEISEKLLGDYGKDIGATQANATLMDNVLNTVSEGNALFQAGIQSVSAGAETPSIDKTDKNLKDISLQQNNIQGIQAGSIQSAQPVQENKTSFADGMEYDIYGLPVTKAKRDAGNVLFGSNTVNESPKESNTLSGKESPLLSKLPEINVVSSKVVQTNTSTKGVIKSGQKIAEQKTFIPDVKQAISQIQIPSSKSQDLIKNKSSQPAIIQPIPNQPTPVVRPAVDKLNRLLKNIDDDIVLEKLDKAKTLYKDALLFYRSMTDENKTLCYEHFYATFKRLDDALHQKSLNDILDKHLSDSNTSNRPVSHLSNTSSAPSDSSDIISSSNPSEDSLKVLNMTTLPVVLVNDKDTTRVYELIEESYFNIDNTHSDLAMLKYFKALELYHKLPIYDKKKLYPDLYDLFKKLSISKKS